jgi:hypothetical protein
MQQRYLSFFIWQAIVSRLSVSTEGLFILLTYYDSHYIYGLLNLYY